jgi:hypothetical protein
MTQRTRMTLVVSAGIVSRLQAVPTSYTELSAMFGIPDRSIRRWMNQMREQVHIHSWGADCAGRLIVPMWAWGSAPDAERPGPSMTDTERMRLLRARRKQEAA